MPVHPELRCPSKRSIPLGEHAEVDVQCDRQMTHRVQHFAKHRVKDVTVTYTWLLSAKEREAAE